MNEIARLVSTAAGLLLSGAVAAQTTFKCTDAAGKVTYSNTQCSKLGLKDAGEVKDRINVNPSSAPAPKAPAREAEGRARPQQPPPRPRVAAPQAPVPDTPAAPEPAQPERRCFTVQTPKGSV